MSKKNCCCGEGMTCPIHGWYGDGRGYCPTCQRTAEDEIARASDKWCDVCRRGQIVVKQPSYKWFCNRCKTFVKDKKCECTKSPSPWIIIDTPQAEIEALNQMLVSPSMVWVKKGKYITLMSDLVLAKDQILTLKGNIKCIAKHKHHMPPFLVKIVEQIEKTL